MQVLDPLTEVLGDLLNTLELIAVTNECDDIICIRYLDTLVIIHAFQSV
jgi:hypothetical protein